MDTSLSKLGDRLDPSRLDHPVDPETGMRLSQSVFFARESIGPAIDGWARRTFWTMVSTAPVTPLRNQILSATQLYLEPLPKLELRRIGTHRLTQENVLYDYICASRPAFFARVVVDREFNRNTNFLRTLATTVYRMTSQTYLRPSSLWSVP